MSNIDTLFSSFLKFLLQMCELIYYLKKIYYYWKELIGLGTICRQTLNICLSPAIYLFYGCHSIMGASDLKQQLLHYLIIYI